MNISTTTRFFFFFVVLFFQYIIPIHGQGITKADTVFHKKIAHLIEARLEQPGGDTASYFILKAVRTECGKDADCLRSYFYAAVEEFEQHGKYHAAIPLAEQLVTLAQSGGDLKAEAAALEKLIMLYNFAENTRKQIAAREKLIQLYEQMGDQDGVIINKAIIQEGRAWDLRLPGEAIREIEALLEQAIQSNLPKTANDIRIRLKYLYEEFRYNEKLAGIVIALEKIPFSDPLQPSEASYAFHAASGRADLLMREKQFDQAASLYQKALEISR